MMNEHVIRAYLKHRAQHADDAVASKLLKEEQDQSLEGINTCVLSHLETFGMPMNMPFFTMNNHIALCEIVQSLVVKQFDNQDDYAETIREIFDQFGANISEEWKELYE